MPFTPAAIQVDPNGLTALVTVTTADGQTITTYMDKNGSTPNGSPTNVAVPTAFWVTALGTYKVSAVVGGVEIASGQNSVATVDLSGGGVAGLQLGAGDNQQAISDVEARVAARGGVGGGVTSSVLDAGVYSTSVVYTANQVVTYQSGRYLTSLGAPAGVFDSVRWTFLGSLPDTI